MSETSSSAVQVPLLPLRPLVFAFNEPTRWKILSILSDGQPKMVSEMAKALGKPMSTISKHMAVLRKSGAVVCGQAGLYRIPAQFIPEPGKLHVDYGYFLLRMDVKEPD